MGRIDNEQRRRWRRERLRLEQRLIPAGRRSAVGGERRGERAFGRLVEALVGGGARLSGLDRPGLRNALALRIEAVEFRFPHLPAAFDGYRILHLSDLHVGTVPGLEAKVAELLAGIGADLAVLTGDFQSRGQPAAGETARLIAPMLAACRAPDGLLAVLGNHDEAALVDALEPLGVRLLLNEWTRIQRGDEAIHILGLDDVHTFHTPAAQAALAAGPAGFRVALVHSVELAHEAERLGFALHLSGHTHGGQICLPGGFPVMTALDRHRALAKGAWRFGRLQGYTSAGTGSGTPPLRFNSRPEIALMTLRRG